jgi:hypothetical protein
MWYLSLCPGFRGREADWRAVGSYQLHYAVNSLHSLGKDRLAFILFILERD